MTRFQLNRRKFVFFTRGGSKLFTPNHLVNCALNMAYYFIKMIWSNFATIIWEVLHKKTSFWALKKWKMVFSSKENENFLRKHCLPFQYAPLCTIWDHLNKLCHECGQKIDHLAWKPLISTRDTSFLRTLFKIIAVLQVCYFFWEHGHI